ncbi:RadC family protein [uncultured Bacteroides sp.]|uniref:JAB domain-containing protein n=1 Tax=uncultured Bacteroides sp. TaxID=162156 RepID=UPI0026079A15|nr:JAB domain-containing protein [uncultured Bacteroides sp.]
MKGNFEINGEYRVMENTELVYILTNSERMAGKVREKEMRADERFDLNAVLDSMTPARRQVAMAAIELYKRYAPKSLNGFLIRCSKDAFEIMQPIVGDIVTEECWAILLNQSAKVIGKKRISCGGYVSTQVDVRIVLREALLAKATAMVLCHNHPSGNSRPSAGDDKLTECMRKAGEALNIRLLDHIIVANDTYYSYQDEGKLF